MSLLYTSSSIAQDWGCFFASWFIILLYCCTVWPEAEVYGPTYQWWAPEAGTCEEIYGWGRNLTFILSWIALFASLRVTLLIGKICVFWLAMFCSIRRWTSRGQKYHKQCFLLDMSLFWFDLTCLSSSFPVLVLPMVAVDYLLFLGCEQNGLGSL